MLDDPALIAIAGRDSTGIRAPVGDNLSRLSQLIEAVARASLGLPRLAEIPLDRAGLITLSDSLKSMSLDAIDDR